MHTLKQIIFAFMLVFALLTTAAAQDSSTATQRSSLTITASAAGERVRITAPSSVVQMRVEVYAASGEKLFDQEIRGGNVFDWHLQDGQAQRLAPGDYVCVVTAKSVSGRLTQKIGMVSVEEKSASVQAADSPQLSAPQAQAIGPVEESSSWMIAGKDEPQTGTVIANDGTDGQMIRGRGALTFRIGNFFSGIDTEQMRLTEDGRLGIGTSDPQANLDVAGTIRAQRFQVARPKFVGVDKTDALAADAVDSVQPLIAGTGTLNRIAKWTPDGSTLGDSAITETAGLVGIGTAAPTQALEVANGRIVTTGSQTLAAAGGILEIGTTLTNNNNAASGIRMRNTFNGNASIQQALDVAPTFAPSASISLARGFISSAFFAPPAGVTITDAFGGNANTLYNNTSGAVTNGTAFAIRSPIVFGSLKPTTQYGLRINNQGIAGTSNSYGLFVDAQSGSTNSFSAIFAGGNVGIGTTNPGAKLDVAGDVNTSTQYNIGGQPVLKSAVGNLFAGEGAGSNTAGFLVIGNSFFGTSAGDTNTTGTFNTIIGAAADVGSPSLDNSTAIGARALVTQSNSLVLGSINGQNGASTDTNVGIGTTAPAARLHVAGASSAAGTPVAIVQSSGNQVPLSFRSGATEVARVRADSQGDLVFATLNGTDKDIFFRAGDDSGTDMFIQSSTGNVGIGSTSPSEKLEVSNGFVLSSGSSGGALIANNPNNQSARVRFDWFNDTPRIRFGGSGVGANNGFVIQGPGDATKLQILSSGVVTIGTLGDTTAHLAVNGKIFLLDVGAGGSGQLCYNTTAGADFNAISFCSSSLRYKTDVRGFTPGLDLLNRLRPVSFRWKGSGSADLGLVAEEVERVDPLLVTYNKQGQVEGVKYDRLGVVILNAVREQQAQIKVQQQQLRAKDEHIASLAARLARYESSLSRYESRLASLERSVAWGKRTKRQVTVRANSTR